jgi:O-antigen/teichoic acid export membrane protein
MKDSDSRTVNSAKNLSIGGASQVLSLVLSFVSRTVFISVLGNEYLSINGLFSNILTLLSFTDIGIGSAIIYSLYKPLSEDNHEKIGKIINLFATAYRYIALTIIVLGLCVIPFLDLIISDVPDINENIAFLYILFLLNTAFSYVYGYKKSLLIADQKNYIVIAISVGLNVLMVALQVAVLLLTHSFVLYLCVMIVITILNNVASTVYVNYKYYWLREYENLKLTKAERDDIFTNIQNIVIYKFGSVIMNGTDNIIISSILKTTLVGICSNYSMLINAVYSIIIQGMAGISASIGNYNIQSSKQESESVFNQLCLLSFWGIGLISLIMMCLLNPFVDLWLGESYMLTDIVVISLVLGFYSTMINTIPSSYRTSMGLFKEARFAPILASLINVILSVVGAYIWGLVGVFMATFVARICTYCVIDPYYIYTKGFESSPRRYYLAFAFRLALLTGIYLICRWIIGWFGLSGITGLIVDFMICLFVFNVIFFSIYVRSPYLKAVTHKVIANFSKKK